MSIKNFSKLLLPALLYFSSSLVHANLLVNSGFENSNSSTATPPGWTNIDHSDGVITYSAFGTPAHEGINYYDLGGYGDANGPIGDGIAQSFATVIGQSYNVMFGLSSENHSGDQTLTVSVGNVSNDYLLNVTGQGVFQKPFVTQSFNFIATSVLSTLSFIHTAGPGGNNDALIDNVIVAETDSNQTNVPEPSTYALLLMGFMLSKRFGFSRKHMSV